MDIGKINKAIVAVLGGAVTVVGVVIGKDFTWATPELLAAIGTAVTSLFVYLVPNKEPEVTE